MVSNALEMSEEELYATLERLRVEHASDGDYAKLRSALPSDWPI
jgi:hypothetical protein